MSNKPGSQTLRLVEGRERHQCIVYDRYPRLDEWPRVSHHHRERRSQMYDDAKRHMASNIITVCGMDNSAGCHGWIYRYPKQTRALDYLLKSCDPEPSTVLVYSVRRDWILPDADG